MHDVLAIPGSLRKQSFNAALARAAQRLAPDAMRMEIYDRLADIPPYDEDADVITPPEPVADLRARIEAADGLLIVTPEYNYSLPGVLKNALDWAARSPDGIPALTGKPTAIAGAAPTNFGTVRAQLALRQMFVWTDTPVVVKPEVMVFRAHERFDGRGELVDETTVSLVRSLLQALTDLIETKAVLGAVAG